MASKIKSVYICSECGYESPNGTENARHAANGTQ